MILLLMCFLVFPIVGHSTELDGRVETKLNTLSLSSGITYLSLSSSLGTSITGIALQAQLSHAFKEKWAAGMSLSQAMLTPSGTLSVVNLRLTYAITGKLRTETKNTTIKGSLDLVEQEFERPTFFVQLLGSQYFLNATKNTVPYTGFGLAGYYKYPLKGKIALLAGGSYEQLSNVESLSVIGLTFGLTYQL